RKRQSCRRCEVVGIEARGGAGGDGTLRLPEPAGSGIAGVARWRRGGWRGEGTHGKREGPEGPGAHRIDVQRLQQVGNAGVRAEGDEVAKVVRFAASPNVTIGRRGP